MTRDPCNAGTVYVCVRFGQSGIYKTTDGGAHWAKAGTLDGCINVRVDPANPQHLYSGDGVGSASDGFWVSNDGGNSWTMPEGFKTAANTVKDYDVYHVEPDPSDFNHVLVTFHYYWQGGNWTGALAGVFESFDGGSKWTIHQPGNPGWDGAGGYDVYFLYNPKLGIGDSKTWLYGTQGKGHWRTTNSGETWTKVTDVSMEHGGGQLYYTQQGVLSRAALVTSFAAKTTASPGPRSVSTTAFSASSETARTSIAAATAGTFRHRQRERRSDVDRLQHPVVLRRSLRDGLRSGQ